MPSSPILVPIAPGELVDKISILALKLERIADAGKVIQRAARTRTAAQIPIVEEKSYTDY